MSQITLHHLERSRSSRILWLFHELDVPYEIVQHKRHPKTVRAPEALREIHPLGKAPVVTVDDLVLAESGAIIEHFVERTGKLGPPAGKVDAYRYWLHYAEGSFMQPMLVRLIFSRVRTAKLPFFVKPIAKGIADKVDANFTNAEVDLHVGFVNAHLADNEWFCGDTLTGADVQMSYPLEAAMDGAGATVDTQHIEAWLARVRARPAYREALAVGGAAVLSR